MVKVGGAAVDVSDAPVRVVVGDERARCPRREVLIAAGRAACAVIRVDRRAYNVVQPARRLLDAACALPAAAILVPFPAVRVRSPSGVPGLASVAMREYRAKDSWSFAQVDSCTRPAIAARIVVHSRGRTSFRATECAFADVRAPLQGTGRCGYVVSTRDYEVFR